MLARRRVVGCGGASSVVEPPLSELRRQLGGMPQTFVARFMAQLRATQEPDDIWQLADALHEFVKPSAFATEVQDDAGAPMRLDRASALGLFARRVHIAFQVASFEELCTVTTSFVSWVAADSGADLAASAATPTPARRVTAAAAPSTSAPTTRSRSRHGMS